MSLATGALPMIGVAAQCALRTGWRNRDGSAADGTGYNVSQYFDASGRYLGPDQDGIEPTFRDLTDAEAYEYLAAENKI